MNNNEGSINFEIGLDTKKFQDNLKEIERKFKELEEKFNKPNIPTPEIPKIPDAPKATREAQALADALRNVKRVAGTLFVLGGAQQFVSQLVNVRDEFQRLEISFATMLQSKDKANKLMAEMVDLAAHTPFSMTEVAEGAKRLLAFQIPAEQVTDTLRRMGDVAAGLSVPMSQLIHVYGQVKAQGRLLTNDLYQFTNAGIPIIAELSKVTGKAENEIKDMVTAGKIGFSEIQQVFQNMTNQGGLFYNLTAEQSKSLGGQISNLKDNIEQMFNEMGKATEGTISSAISGVAYLVEHYKQVGKVISVLVATYGTYKASLIAQGVAQQIVTKYGVIDAATKKLQIRATIQAMLAQNSLTKAMLANPYTLVAAAVVGLIAAIWQFSNATTAAEQAQESFNKEMSKLSDLRDKERQQVDDLLSTLKDETKSRGEQNQALLKLQALYPAIFKQYQTEAELLNKIGEARQKAYADIDESDAKRKEDYVRRLEDRLKTLKDSSANANGTDLYSAYKKDKEIQAVEAELAKARRATAWTKTQNKINELSNLSPEEQRRQQALIREEINRRKNAQVGVGQKQIPLTMPAFQSTGYEQFDFKDLGLINQKTDSFLKVSKAQITTFDDLLKKRAELQKGINNIKAQLTAKGANVNDETLNKQLAEQEAALKAVNTQIEKLETKSTKKGGTKTTKAEKTPYDIEAEKRRIERQQEDLHFANEEQRIQQLEEGYDKEDELIRLRYEQRKINIQRLEQDALATLIAERKKQYEYEHGNAKGFDPSVVQLDEATKGEFTQMRNYNEAEKLQAQDKLYQALLDKYKTYAEEEASINKKYAEERAALEKQLTGETLKQRLAESKKAQNKELFELQRKYKAEGKIVGRLFEDFSKKSLKDLEELFKAATEEFAKVKDELDPDNLAAYTNRLEQLKEKLRDTRPFFQQFAQDIKTMFGGKGVEKGEAANRFVKGLGSLSNMSGSLTSFVGDLYSMFGGSGLKQANILGQSMTNMLSGAASFAGLGATLGTAVSAGSSAGPIGAAIGAVVGLAIGGIKSAINNMAEAREEAARVAQYAKDTALFLQQQKWSDEYIYKENNKEVFEDKKIERARKQMQELSRLSADMKNKINNELRGIRVLDWVETHGGIKSWWKKTTDHHKDILDKYKEIVTKEGDINVELAKNLIKQELVRDEHLEQLKKMVAEQEQINKLREDINKYFKDVFGEFGNDLIDAAWDAVRQGEDAMKYFGTAVEKIVSKIGKQLILESFFKDKLEEIANKAKGIIGSNNADSEKMRSLQTLLASEKGALENRVRGAEFWFKEWQKMEKDLGIAPDDTKQRTAQTKGFQAMGQDTANELNARFTLMTELQRVSNEEIKKMTASALKAKENLDTLRENSLKSLFHLANIDANTYTLHQMSKDMANIKNSFEEIKLHGIKVK
ncbi:hypothetical protein SAMN05444369_101286 [Capnocytophaga haemolytica]|jgi:hypothetical protein|uniref:Phage-related protein n=1 Tax=Capnocytophaga haemolytica TaxID=45243 RepID=A0AAX2GVG0_9FLAO|nr:tape measure protein [Capnocytophaga haemolytica]AMD85118.1 hypothetical protein AXF12_06050 [Capnocytophaga haemolytica]SFN67588.1 hypothetical protein SAMN05444369_101286 [Capnocytophaga haemolytica]SNV04867.1 Phage-related protein [Capnocytophaga haemolytica]